MNSTFKIILTLGDCVDERLTLEVEVDQLRLENAIGLNSVSKRIWKYDRKN